MTKRANIINAFRKEKSLNRFEAENFGDHCLNSTVSELIKLGYSFHKEWEKVPTRFGTKTTVKRYWLIAEPKEKRTDGKVSALS